MHYNPNNNVVWKSRNTKIVPGVSADALTWRNHPDIRAVCRNKNPINQADHDRWVASLVTNDTIRPFIITTTLVAEDNALPGVENEYPKSEIGTCFLSNITDYEAEFSILINPEFQGVGAALPAMRQLLSYGFNELGLDLIYGETYSFNKKGLAFFKKVGFNIGECVDDLYQLSMTREEFENAKSNTNS